MYPLSVLTDFFSVVREDPRIGPTHISLYAALLELWQRREFENPLTLFSHEVMPLCKIAGVATYHKSIRDLNRYGYIKYMPSHDRFTRSLVYLPG